ncbi:MAG: hypothetical protein NAG76_11275 [Candidatus Pristimantibacillus lignocellulolyticus]|uniref:Uncharacterized protein n=1 Tax=Candidatus Pristimantibacillus lignocellulolyticus TaxID=2994561 RepID=A0A9J6Z8U5_9BACL|nr:MAG: hypothetical protein NAG76_11275 [Candidatus Pristimantibacillus lignocellulolyticus]
MLKLFKYNWLRNSTIFYATITVLLLLQVALIIADSYWENIDGLILGLSVFVFSIGALILFTQICSTYNNNLKSYNRRLLPVAPIKEIGALVLLQIIYVLIMTALIVIVNLILLPKISFVDMELIHTFFDRPSLVIFTFVSGLWFAVSMLIFIMLSIAIAACFKVKNRVWIGIASAIIITIVIAYISELLFGAGVSAGIEMTTGEEGFRLLVPSNKLMGLSGEIAFDVITVLLALFAMTYLMNKKIEL